MSISPGVVVTVALKQIDNTPNAKPCSKGDNQSLQNAYCTVKKLHKMSSLSAAFAAQKMFVFVFGYEKSRRFLFGGCAGGCPQGL